MKEIPQLLLLLVLAGIAVTAAGSLVAWYMQEVHTLARAMKRVLGGRPDAMIIAHGRGRAAGFNFANDTCAVAWDAGNWCLVYRIEELAGAEVMVDGIVVARAFRNEPRKALDQTVPDANRVTLRLIFDDPHHPDFELDLWVVGDEIRRRGEATATGAIKEANRWMARAEAILRRPGAPKAAAVRPPPPPPSEQPTLFDDDPDDL
ncbi:MAG: hypothetical protein CFE28_08375 [Alphaproteobacteria bacterium PA2]|nr:MAG: hypothetical protein CFE28_08375 [Alphaproteobacteria bacterium PA2]